jgi:hypothetical protein
MDLIWYTENSFIDDKTQVHYDPINGPRIENGVIKLPKGGPGLGLVIDEGIFGIPDQVHN